MPFSNNIFGTYEVVLERNIYKSIEHILVLFDTRSDQPPAQPYSPTQSDLTW